MTRAVLGCRRDERGARLLDLLMVVLTLVAFAVFVAMVAWLERI
ncbi:MAG TPA: hypothetical protein VFM81_08690 [Actinomycetota bacterium]|nr:hypothetical protein [Actinomycetota bacterium]